MDINEYEERQAAKKARYEELAQKNRDEAARRRDYADRIASVMNGQPILVGHHSEKRHRNDIDKMHKNMRKGIEHAETAEYYDRKAEGIGKGGISSDDPEAIQKLEIKVVKLEKKQEFMKAANKAIRMKNTDKGDAILLEMGVDRRPDIMGCVGFPSYALQNNNANIRRIKARIETLRSAPTETTQVEHGDITVVENADENRVQIIFPGKPSAEVRTLLKSSGFRWSPRNGAWQRHLNNSGRYAAQSVMKEIQS